MFCRTQTFCSFYLLFVFKTFVSTPKNKEVFPQHSDLSSSCLIVSLCSIFAPSLYLVLLKPFALLHCPKPPSCTTSHSLTLRQETISLLLNRTPQNHIGYTLSVGIIKSHGQVTRLLFPISYLMEVVNLANGSITL